MTIDDRRALASLVTLRGFGVLVKVVESKRDEAIAELKRASQHEEIVNAALKVRTWDDALVAIRETPKATLEELKTEGDDIYG